jgi:O-antigen ligase
MNLIDRLILLSFPLMDVGFILFGIPFRLGELTLFLSFLRIINSNSILKIKKVNKIALSIICLVTFNLFYIIIINLLSEVDIAFYLKYVLRNFIYIFTLLSFILKPIEFNKINNALFIKYILYLVSIFYIIEFIDYYLINFNWSDLVFVSRQSKYKVQEILIRFAGQASEPAFIIPLLSIPLLYGLLKRKYQYFLIALVYMILPFSSFGYAVIFFGLVYFFRNVDDKKLKKKAESFLIKLTIGLPFIAVFFYKRIFKIVEHNFEKFSAYFNLGNAKNWSASQRSGHIDLAIDLFVDSSIFRMLFGNGTGYYSKMSKAFTKYYLDNAEEAHNLYVSTLVDRGIIGLIILLLLFYCISRIKMPNKISDDSKFLFIAIKFGVYVRMFHWVFTGMLWQYYFWVEVILLLSASTYYLKVRNEER